MKWLEAEHSVSVASSSSLHLTPFLLQQLKVHLTYRLSEERETSGTVEPYLYDSSLSRALFLFIEGTLFLYTYSAHPTEQIQLFSFFFNASLFLLNLGKPFINIYSYLIRVTSLGLGFGRIIYILMSYFVHQRILSELSSPPLPHKVCSFQKEKKQTRVIAE